MSSRGEAELVRSSKKLKMVEVIRLADGSEFQCWWYKAGDAMLDTAR